MKLYDYIRLDWISFLLSYNILVIYNYFASITPYYCHKISLNGIYISTLPRTLCIICSIIAIPYLWVISISPAKHEHFVLYAISLPHHISEWYLYLHLTRNTLYSMLYYCHTKSLSGIYISALLGTLSIVCYIVATPYLWVVSISPPYHEHYAVSRWVQIMLCLISQLI